MSLEKERVEALQRVIDELRDEPGALMPIMQRAQDIFGYLPEDVQDVQEIMSCGRWELEQIITHEFPLSELEQAIRTAGDVDHAGNVVIRMPDAGQH